MPLILQIQQQNTSSSVQDEVYALLPQVFPKKLVNLAFPTDEVAIVSGKEDVSFFVLFASRKTRPVSFVETNEVFVIAGKVDEIPLPNTLRLRGFRAFDRFSDEVLPSRGLDDFAVISSFVRRSWTDSRLSLPDEVSGPRALDDLVAALPQAFRRVFVDRGLLSDEVRVIAGLDDLVGAQEVLWPKRRSVSMLSHEDQHGVITGIVDESYDRPVFWRSKRIFESKHPHEDQHVTVTGIIEENDTRFIFYRQRLPTPWQISNEEIPGSTPPPPPTPSGGGGQPGGGTYVVVDGLPWRKQKRWIRVYQPDVRARAVQPESESDVGVPRVSAWVRAGSAEVKVHVPKVEVHVRVGVASDDEE